MQQKIEQQEALYKAYNAVPPPPLLYADPRRVNSNLCPNLNTNLNYRRRMIPNFSTSPSSNPSDGDSDRKARRRRARRAQDVAPEAVGIASSCGSNGTKEGFPVRHNESLRINETQECTSSLRSPSSDCMPRPSFTNKCCESTNASSGDVATQPSNGLARTTATPNKARCRDIPISKLKYKDMSKDSLMFTADPKPEKMTYSPKVMPSSSKHEQDCSCSGLPVSRFSSEEASTSNAFQAGRDERGSGNLKHEFMPWKSRCNQRPRSEKLFGCFQQHWPLAKVEKAIKEGKAFRCKIRINAHCRSEAYVSIDGVPVDVLLDGTQAQNRSIDGDIVAVVINPISMWAKLKGFVSKQNSTDLKIGLDDSLAHANKTASIDRVGCSDDEIQLDYLEQGMEATGGESSTDILTQTDNALGVSGSGEVLSTDSSRQNSLSKTLGGDEHLPLEFMDACLLFSASKGLHELVGIAAAFPDKRPTGEVVAILEKSDRRQSVVGSLEIYQKAGNKCGSETFKKYPYNDSSTLTLVPSDSRFPKMTITVNSLPSDLKERYYAGDATLESELVAACVTDWKPDCSAPHADITHSLGQGGEIEAQLAAILFEQAVHSAEFPLPALKCLPEVPWSIPAEEFGKRKNLTKSRIFTIDPRNARDLDDALSFERLENGLCRIGVHISDVSYFVLAETELDKEAQLRSTSVYLIQRVLPMLPRLLCEELCSLNPGVDRLALSIMWDVDDSGQIKNHWIGRTIINSCSKLSYSHAQDMIEGKLSVNSDGVLDHGSLNGSFPELHRDFKWVDIVEDIKSLHGIAKCRRDARFEAGALRLENSRLVFDLDEDGIPVSSSLYEHHDSNFLVEEFMLLANMTAAKVIATAFPNCALLRRHPEPNSRKLKELEEFCNKSGFELDATSSGSLHESLKKLCGMYKEDPVMCSILMLYATKPMQLAKYFSTGELKNEEDWAHYALATPFYTHFTSPIRRYPDIVVHRTLLAASEVEDVLSGKLEKETSSENEPKSESSKGQLALVTAALKYKVPGSQDLALLAEHCNRRKLASRNVRDASDKLYLWAMLKQKEGIFSEARVLAVGPKFLSLYVQEIAMERRVYYDDTDGLGVEWFNMTATVILDLVHQKSARKERYGKGRALSDVACVMNPAHSSDVMTDEISSAKASTHSSDGSNLELRPGTGANKKPEPAVLPLTLCLLTSVPVHVCATGGNAQPLDIGVRLYLSSYIQ